MTQIVDGVMLLLSSSLAASILGKATLIAILGLIGAWLTRRSRAAVRHAVLAASFAVLLALPIASTLIKPVRLALPASTLEWVPQPAPMDATQPAASVDGSAVVVSAAQRWRRLSPSALLLAVWIAGAAFFLLRMVFGLQQVRALRRFSLPWRAGQSVVDRLALDAGIYRRVEVLLHESLPAPVTCGIVRPAIVLPPDSQDWEGEDLNRAIIHELEHVRRFDWASHCLARIACAVYWFHPLVWAAWRQLALEAERSCDDAVLARSEATAYADQLVGLARRLSVARLPALAMANRSDLSTRVGSVLDGSRARGRAGASLAAVACAVAAAVVLTMSPLRMVAAPQSAGSAAAGAQTAKTFDVISIRPDKDGHGLDSGTQPGGRYTARNVPAQFLVTEAFGIKGFQVAGAPKWLNDERYDIVAKVDTPNQLSQEQLRPLLQAMLVDRFKLKFHREMREFPTYSLVVGKNGPKFNQSPGGQAPYLNVSSNNGRASMTGQSMPMSALAQNLAGMVGRTVADNTGLKGDFDFKFAWAPGEVVSDELPDIFTALQEQLGLRLDIVKRGAMEVIVIERMEKASAN